VSEIHPRVSVGVPVFNGESYLAETLDSLLNQTFHDLEIVISDNASTDRTDQICRDYAARDPRIRYHRSDVNRGAAWNHNRVFELARGEFFKWNSADDLCAPEFLARCVAVLDQDSSAVMACSNVSVIDDYGDVVKQGFVPPEVASQSAPNRFRRTIQTNHWCFNVYSLMRSAVLRQTDLIGSFLGSDRVLLSHLCLLGRCVLIDETLMFNRDHPARFNRTFALNSREGAAWFDPKVENRKFLFPAWKQFGALREAISRSPIKWQERLQCYGSLLAWARHHRSSLLQELLRFRTADVSGATADRNSAAAAKSIALAGAPASTPQKLGSRALKATEPIQNADSMNVTVIVCTFNRCQDLARALESIAASKMPNAITWEVVVVDNNSTDQTAEVVEDFRRRYPGRFRYLLETNRGKAYALNAGVASALGETLVFVDDDVTMDSGWLRNLTAELHTGEWAGAAGRILPATRFTPPRWLSWKHCGGILCGNFDLGNRPCELDPDHAPHGGNMAFRREMFARHGAFHPDLGPGPNRVPNGDTEFGRRLMKAGERLRYEPLAVVYHPVAESRLTKQYFLSWWFDYGRAYIIEQGDRPDVLGIPRDYLSLVKRMRDIAWMSLRNALAIRPTMRFFWKCMVWKQAGMIVELYRRLPRRRESKIAVLP
jgi:glycosyltransferase involved in cell wall biosynthesis